MAEDNEAKEISQLDSLAVRDSALIPIYDPQYGLGKATMDSVKEVCGVGTTRNGVCSTAGATQDKAVSYSGFILSDGKEIVVKFTNANTATNPRLNVNSTGAKTIKFMDQASGVSAGLNCFVAGAYYKFTYNATDNVWVCHSNIVERDSSAGYTKYADGRTEYKNSIYKTQIIELPVNTNVEYTVSTGFAYIFIASGSNYAHYAGIMVLPYNQNGVPQQLIKWAGANITADATTFGKVIFRQNGGGTVNLSVFRIFL